MIATNKIYLGGVEHFARLSHNLLTVVLCDPVYRSDANKGNKDGQMGFAEPEITVCKT